MYSQHHNKTAIRSQQMISDTLTHLMEKKPFPQITITEICKKAYIGRKTFYRHFESKEDVIDYQLDLLCDEYSKIIISIPLEERLHQHFVFVKTHMPFFLLMYRHNMLSQLHEKFLVFLPDTMPIWTADPVEQEYRSRYIIAGIEAIQRLWVERNFQESIDDIVEMAIRAQEQQIPLR